MDGEERRVKQLEKIARAAGILPVGLNYRRTFMDCTTMRQKEARLHEMLRDAGMHGAAFGDSDRKNSREVITYACVVGLS